MNKARFRFKLDSSEIELSIKKSIELSNMPMELCRRWALTGRHLSKIFELDGIKVSKEGEPFQLSVGLGDEYLSTDQHVDEMISELRSQVSSVRMFSLKKWIVIGYLFFEQRLDLINSKVSVEKPSVLVIQDKPKAKKNTADLVDLKEKLKGLM